MNNMNLNFTKKLVLTFLTGAMSLSVSGQCANQLVNGGFEIDATTGWTTTSGGDGFALTGTSHSGSNGLKGSYSWSSQVQVVDLVAAGYTTVALDAQPNIEVSEWYRSDGGGADEYYYKAELLDGSMTVLQTFSLGSEVSPIITTGAWQEVNNLFTSYGVGVRFVRITHGSKDTEYWAGHYGAVIDDSFVGVGSSNTGTDTQVACDAYEWIDGSTYTTDNTTATHTLTNMFGCDSVITLNLTINSVSDLTTSLSGLTITAANTGASYRWLDCNSGFTLIAGETNQSFTATANGNYAIELTENGCVDTSACVAITTVGIVESEFGESLVVYPNPTNGNFSVDLGSVYNSSEIRITDMSGKLIYSKMMTESQILNLSLKEPSGIYIVSIQSDDKMAVIRLVKK